MINSAFGPARRFAALLVLAAISFGCATPPQTQQLLRNPVDLPLQVELTSVPFFPQTEFHCGPAALASIVNYHGIPVGLNQLVDMVYVPGLEGSLQVEIVAAARRFDLLPVVMDGRLKSVMREVASGNPVFVLHNLGLDSVPSWHYEVVIGYDLEHHEFILRSGEHRRVRRSFDVFERTWQRAQFWSLALTPADRVPASASRSDFLDAVIGVEQVGRVATAHQGYRSAAQRWPDSVLAHSGIGNTAFALGDFTRAESAYRTALALEPQQADIWNNLAYALDRLGRKQSSKDAIRQALALEPDNPDFQHSYHELINRQ